MGGGVYIGFLRGGDGAELSGGGGDLGLEEFCGLILRQARGLVGFCNHA